MVSHQVRLRTFCRSILLYDSSNGCGILFLDVPVQFEIFHGCVSFWGCWYLFVLDFAARFLFFAIQPFLMENILNLPHPVQFIVSTAPSFFFFSAYLMILFFWYESDSISECRGDIYNKTAKSTSRAGLSNRVFLVFIMINIIMYIIVLTLYLLNSFLEKNWSKNSFTPYEIAVLMVSASMYVITSVSFFCYG